jgi:hypothetical protein
MELIIILIVVIGAGGLGFYYYEKNRRAGAQNPEPMKLAKNANTLTACVETLEKLAYIEPFAQDIQQNIEQIERYTKKRETINTILLQKFTATEMSYNKFDGVLAGVENVVYINLRSIINKISAFDYEEYKQLDTLEWNKDDLAKEKMSIYNEYLTFVDEATRDNEEILLKLDRLLLEVTHWSETQEGDIMDMPAIAELDKLIKNVKLYA